MGAGQNIYEHLTGSVNFELDFGGSSAAADNATALAAFNTYARAESLAGRRVTMLVPPGLYQFNHKNCVRFLYGIKQLHIIGYGAIFQNTYNPSVEGANFAYEIAWSPASNPTHLSTSPYGRAIQNTTVGATTVTLVTLSDHSIFSVGKWVLISSVDIQPHATIYGYPPNLDYCEYAKITAINTDTGVITIDPPIRFAHRTDFYDRGDFGKAKIAPLDSSNGLDSWDLDHVYEGLEIRNSPNTTVSYFPTHGRHVQFLNCIIPGISPTVAELVEYMGCTITAGSEPDKLVNRIVCERCTFPSLNFQSSSINSFAARDCHVKGQFIPGNVKMMLWEGGSIGNLNLDGMLYGMNRKQTFIGATVHSVPAGINIGVAANTTIDGTNASFANGRFSILKTHSLSDYWGTTPGAMLYLRGPSGLFPGDLGTGIVTKLTADATYWYIDTTLPFTALPAWANGAMSFQRQGELHVINCTGCDEIRLASEAERRGKAPWEYKRYLFGGTTSTDGYFLGITGEMARFRVNVLKVSPQANTRLTFTAFNCRTQSAMDDPLTIEIVIDATVAGVRDFTLSALTGKQTNDTVKLNAVAQTTLPANRWIGGTLFWAWSSLTIGNYSDYQLPVIELEIEITPVLFRKPTPMAIDGQGRTVFGVNGTLP